MKKSTLFIWAIIIGMIALLIFQNQTFFMTHQTLRINLGVIEEYQTPDLPIAVTFIAFFLAGVIIAYLFNISARFKAGRTIKKLTATADGHGSVITELKREIDALKGQRAPVGDKTTVLDLSTINKTQNTSSGASLSNSDESPSAFAPKKTADKSDDSVEEKSKEK